MRRFGIVIAIALGLLVLPVGDAAADACQDLFCPLGLDVCVPAMQSQIEVCRKIGEVDRGIATVNAAVVSVGESYEDVHAELLKIQADLVRVQAGFAGVSNVAAFFDQYTRTAGELSAETLRMSADLASTIEEARRVADFSLQFARGRYLAFVEPGGCASECQQFREALLRLIDEMESTFNLAVAAVVAQMPADLRGRLIAQPRLDLSPLRRLIEAMPGVLLFPIHEAFALLSAPETTSGSYRIAVAAPATPLHEVLIVQLARMGEGLRAIIERAIPFVNDGGTSLCVAISGMDSGVRQALATAAAIASVVARILYEVGDILETWGFNRLDTRGAIDFGAFVGQAIDARPIRTVGKALKGLSTLSMMVTEAVTRRFNSCRIVMEQQVTLCVLASTKAKSFDQCRRDVAAGARFGF